jgi:ATP-dependent Clp protease ATP-binding subunit ClpA
VGELSLHKSVVEAWDAANLEACRFGDSFVHPRYLLAGLLALLCDTSERANEPDMMAVVQQTRRLVGLSQEQAAEALRGLRLALRPMGPENSLSELPRSKESHRVFARAAQLALAAGSERATSVHLAQALGEHLPTDQGERWLPGLARDFHAARAFADQSPRAAQEVSAPQTPEGDGATTPTLTRLGRDLTALARSGRLVPLVGRQKEVRSIARHLLRTSKRNVLVIGDAGVGKTAIIEGLAQYFASGSAPEPLASLRIIQVSLGDVVAGTRYRGDLEERLQALVDEAIRTPSLVLFLDEVHLAVGGGTGSDNPMDVANILKPALARAEFRCIGATTTSEYERFVKPDTAFTRRFQLVRVPEPSQEEAIEICTGWARRIESMQNVRFEPDAIRACVELSILHLRDRALPDKAIDLLENAVTMEKLSSLSPPPAPLSQSPATVGRPQIEAALKEQYGVVLDASKP